MHSELLLDHFQNPRNVGELAPPAVMVEVMNPACGDILRLSALAENGVVIEVRYQVRGCTASIAAGSALTEIMQGRATNTIAAITPAEVEAAIGGLIMESKHAAVLCRDAARALAAKLG
jgi:nitrogen fixation protein NifU and related proteins